MSYNIIFETKICKLDNGDIIHFSLQGCNNDNCGRSRDDFSAKYYTAEDWEKEIAKWESIETTDGFNLKIRNRYCSWADYGKHLRRMTKRAQTFNEMKKDRTIYGTVFEGIIYCSETGIETFCPANNTRVINEIVYSIGFGMKRGSYKNIKYKVETLEDIVNILQSNKHVRFYISKKQNV